MNFIILVSSLDFGGEETQAIQDANLLSEIHKVWLIYFMDGPQRPRINSKVNVFQIEKKGRKPNWVKDS